MKMMEMMPMKLARGCQGSGQTDPPVGIFEKSWAESEKRRWVCLLRCPDRIQMVTVNEEMEKDYLPQQT